MAKGKVYLVGAGPGDVELLTVKAYRLICEADVILYDHLIAVELLRLARPGAEVIPVGKFASRHTLPQRRINELLIEKAAGGKTVVRLKGGDPYLFGRGAEEAVCCAEAGVDFEVVPGISSALAGPAYAGIPATHRDYTSSVAIVTGHRKSDELEIEIPRAGTVIFLMGVSNIERIVESLIRQGRAGETKIAAVENATCYNQRIISGTLDNFVETAKEAGLRAPAVVIVGRVVELREKLGWFRRRPRILFVGTSPEKYRHLGTIVHRPLIKLVGLEDYSEADGILGRLNDYDWVVFTSRNGVRYFFERLNALGLDGRAFGPAKAAVIGATTAAELKSYGILADIQPKEETSAGLLEEFRKIPVGKKRILLVRPQAGADTLPQGLAGLGAICEQVAVYRNVEVEPDDVDFDFIDQVLFTSGSTVRAYVKHFGAVPAGIRVFCLGPPTLAEAVKHGITQAEILPKQQHRREKRGY